MEAGRCKGVGTPGVEGTPLHGRVGAPSEARPSEGIRPAQDKGCVGSPGVEGTRPEAVQDQGEVAEYTGEAPHFCTRFWCAGVGLDGPS